MDITILYYTANLISNYFADNVRRHLLESSGGKIPIISISQKPIDFGKNICVLGFKPSIYNIYRQILIGAKQAQTKYVACCEDDTLYVPEHFDYIPPDDSFAYNNNRWNIKKDMFYFRTRHHPTSGGMCMCMASTELMVKTLEKRFEKYPEQPASLIGFGEPGRYDHRIGLDRPKAIRFVTETPSLTFVHRKGQGGIRRVFHKVDKIEKDIPYWGNAKELWNRIHGGLDEQSGQDDIQKVQDQSRGYSPIQVL